MEALATILKQKKSVDIQNKKSILSNYEAKQIRRNKQLNEVETIEKIADVIGDLRYVPKYKKMVRDGFSTDLQDLADIARTKDNPVTYFIKCASKASWEKTLQILEKCRKVLNTSYEIADKLKETHSIDHLRAAWKLIKKNVSPSRTLAQAIEVGKNKNKLWWHLVGAVGA